jgi:hypothetical protein
MVSWMVIRDGTRRKQQPYLILDETTHPESDCSRATWNHQPEKRMRVENVQLSGPKHGNTPGTFRNYKSTHKERQRATEKTEIMPGSYKPPAQSDSNCWNGACRAEKAMQWRMHNTRQGTHNHPSLSSHTTARRLGRGTHRNLKTHMHCTNGRPPKNGAAAN